MSLGIGVGTSFVFPQIPRGGGVPFEYTAIDNSFSMDIDGIGYFQIPDFTVPFVNEANANGELSFVSWVKTESVFVNYFAAGSGTVSTGPFTFQFSGKNIRLTLKDSSATSYVVTGTDQLITDINTWFHCAWTWNASKPSTERMRIYVNGVSDSARAAGPADIQFNPAASFFNTNTLLGRSVSSTGASTAIKIDESAFFTKELSEQTILAMYNATANNPGKVADLSETPEQQPVAWFRMGD